MQCFRVASLVSTRFQSSSRETASGTSTKACAPCFMLSQAIPAWVLQSVLMMTASGFSSFSMVRYSVSPPE